MAEQPIPNALREAFERWDREGRPKQPGITWTPTYWRAALPQHGTVFDRLPPKVNRADIPVAAGPPTSPEGAQALFVAAMVWGYGRVGYGPFRTSRVLATNPDAAQRLVQIAEVLAAEGGVAAFEALSQNRLRFLGVAFATKYLFFVDLALGQSGTPALILDALVQRWLSDNTGWRPRLNWRVADYRQYVELLVEWGERLGVHAAVIEELIFRDQVRSDPQSQWNREHEVTQVVATAAEGEAAAGPAAADHVGLLDLLDEVEEQLEAIDSFSEADFSDAALHLRHLRRIAKLHLPTA